MIQYINDIKNHYELLSPHILSLNPKKWVSPYGYITDWHPIMSPIEVSTWLAIRSYGKIPLYPQYPIGKYFADFANPVLRIALECDGKAYHLDKEKDEKRDTTLFKEHGYAVYRVPGADCAKRPSDSFYYVADCDNQHHKVNIMDEYYSNTIEGLLESLAYYYLKIIPFYKGVDDEAMMIECLNQRVSLKEEIYHEPKYRLCVTTGL